MLDQPKPVYQRLRDVIANAILDGAYRDGDMLPSVRSLAADEGANPLTVAKAYQLFQDEALIVVKRGVGMFVAEGAKGCIAAERRDGFVQSFVHPLLAEARTLGLDRAEVIRLIETETGES